MAVMTGLSGNEIYCLHLKGMRPGDLVVGNSVFSMGFIGSIGAGINTLLGGEVQQVTGVIARVARDVLLGQVGQPAVLGVQRRLVWADHDDVERVAVRADGLLDRGPQVTFGVRGELDRDARVLLLEFRLGQRDHLIGDQRVGHHRHGHRACIAIGTAA